VGALAMDFIRAFKVDYALIGASALDADGTLLDFDVDEVRVSQTIIEQARTVILATDQTKFGRPAPVRIAEIGIVDHLVTDRLLHPGIAAACAAGQVKVTQTDA